MLVRSRLILKVQRHTALEFIMTDEILGVTTCPTCQKRFRVSKKYESFIGKPINCPKCHRPFEIQLESPAPIEQAAMASADQTSSSCEGASSVAVVAKPKKKTRTKAEIRKAAYKRIRKEFGPYLKQLEAIAGCDTASEERVRVWCCGVLQNALGYKAEDLDFEVSAGKGKIDIVVKDDDKIMMVIECKKPGQLPAIARKAAIGYAIQVSADWAVATNGQTWELHRVIPVSGENVCSVEIFNISLLDEDGLSPYDVERMYHLTKRALLRGETEKVFHKARALENKQLLAAMFTSRTIKAIRRSLGEAYKKHFKQYVGLTLDDVHLALKELIRPEELGGDQSS
jgi:type I restriction and modification enzyme subunit R-like protein